MKKSLVTFLLAIGMCFGFTACDEFNELFEPVSSESAASSNSSNQSSSDDSSSSSSGEEQKQYVTVTFKQSGCADIVKTLEKGETLTDIPATQGKTGYTVIWDTTDFTNITDNMTVNALETAKKYTVTYDANGGTVTTGTQEVTFDAETTLATPTREDYLFNGWTYEGAAVINGAKWTIADNVMLVADWIDNRPIYTVTFVDGTQSTEVEVKKGEDLSAEDVPAFIGKTGYSVSWDITDYTNIQANMTVTAEYRANTYTITYDADGFAIDGTTVELTYDAVCAALDMSLTREDANFLGWKYGEATYTNTSVWNVANSVTVTPDWKAKDKVTVVFTDTDGSTINKTIYKGQDLTDIPTPKVKTGYSVDNVWYADEAFTQTATFMNVQESCTVYAKATANTYTVNYDANGGSVSAPTQDIVFDTEYTLITPTHEKAYMRFDGWQMKSGNMLALTGTWTIAEGMELTAKWTDTRATLTISFMQAGQETKTFSVKEGEAFTEIPAPVEKIGYTVVWDRTDFTNITENITVNVIETAKTYIITLNVNGGNVSNATITVTYGEAYELPTPTHDDKAFDCWMYNGKKIAVTGIWNIDVDETITFVAQWGKSAWTENY